MSEIKLPPPSGKLHEDGWYTFNSYLIKYESRFAPRVPGPFYTEEDVRAAVELNRPQVPEDAGWLAQMVIDKLGGTNDLPAWVRQSAKYYEEALQRAERAKADLAAAHKENDALRGIAAKVMPCHYCGVDHISKCPHGFPGCALADDMMCAEESAVVELRRVIDELAAARDDIKSLREDAERYRWLRDERNWSESGPCPVVATCEETIYGVRLDRAIDAARAK